MIGTSVEDMYKAWYGCIDNSATVAVAVAVAVADITYTYTITYRCSYYNGGYWYGYSYV